MKRKQKFEIRKIGRQAKPGRKKHPHLNQIKQVGKVLGIFVMTLALSTLVYFQEQTGEWFKASILEAPAPFDGAMWPVAKVPDWSNWGFDNKTAHFNEVPKNQLIDLPDYDLATLAFPNEQLEWGNPNHDVIRNTKITYSVVYLGSYDQHHFENTGSHLAVDIRMPTGTPLMAMANGKITKVSLKNTGFGHHVVIKHIDVPDPDNPGKTTTLYSAYNHMDRVDVLEGQNVKRGEVIGTSGNTGTSTTPHLHFQIDKESAPWHPYWAFTWQESQEAGLSFFEAVNAGLGILDAKEKTVNPMVFITQHLNVSEPQNHVIAETKAIEPETVELEVTETPKETLSTITETTETATNLASATTSTPPSIVASLPTKEVENDPSLLTFQLTGEDVTMIGSGVRIIVKDKYNKLQTLEADQVIPIEVEGVGKSTQANLRKTDFQGDTTTVVVKSDKPGISNVSIGKSSFQITFIEKIAHATALQFKHDGHFQAGVVEEIKLIAVDADGNPTPGLNFSGDIAVLAKEGKATISPNRLNVRDFENGIATLRVKAVSDTTRLILRAQNGALVGESTALTKESGQLFTDVGGQHKNFEAIKFLKEEGIISGYADGSFKPEKTVNRVEALKMLMLAFDLPAGAATPLPFKDTQESAWYAGTVATALNQGIAKGYTDGTFRPAQTVNRAEYLKLIFNTAGVEWSGAIVADPYSDVDRSAWFAPYAYLANKRNIIDAQKGNLYPADGMTRADVAETIYRMKMIEEKELVSYEK